MAKRITLTKASGHAQDSWTFQTFQDVRTETNAAIDDLQAQISAIPTTTTPSTTGSKALFVQTANIATTPNVYSTLFGSGVGSLTIPANFFNVVGKTVRVKIVGRATVADGGYFPHNIYLLLGGSGVVNAAAFLSIDVPAAVQFTVYAELICRTTGASGSISGSVRFESTDGGGGPNTMGDVTLSPVTVDTTSALALDVQYFTNSLVGVLTSTAAIVDYTSVN